MNSGELRGKIVEILHRFDCRADWFADELAEFYAECLVHRGIGDAAVLQQENEKLRKQNERH